MRHPLVLALAAAVVVAGLRVALDESGPIPLVLVPQGVSAYNVSGPGRVFILREGGVLYAVSALTRKGKPVTWCGRKNNAQAGGIVGEDVFWSREFLDVYDRYGNVARGGAAGQMVPLRIEADESGFVHVERRRPEQTPPKVGVAQETLEFYERWLNRANIPSVRKPIWCPNPVR